MKRASLRYALFGVALALMLYGGVMGLYLVDLHSRAKGFGDDNALMSIQSFPEAGSADITVFGKGYTLDVKTVKETGEMLSPLLSLIPPGIRLLPDLYQFLFSQPVPYLPPADESYE